MIFNYECTQKPSVGLALPRPTESGELALLPELPSWICGENSGIQKAHIWKAGKRRKKVVQSIYGKKHLNPQKNCYKKFFN